MSGFPAHLAELPRRLATAAPAAVLAELGTDTLTARRLDRASRSIAAALGQNGVRPGDRVAFLDKNSLRFIEALFGALRAGGVLSGVNFRLAVPEIRYILDDAQARVVFVGRDYYAAMAELDDGSRTFVALDGGHAAWPSLSDWADCEPTDLPELDAGADLLQLYTSGTTGRPKGARIGQDAWLRFARSAIAGWARMSGDDRQLVCMPLCHIAGINSVLLSLLQGSRIVLLRDVDPAAILEAVAAGGVTTMLLAPAIIQGVLAAADPSADYRSLRALWYGASPIAEQVLADARALFGCDFVHLYGLTECLGAATFLPPEDHGPARGKLRSCGRPYRGAEVRIVAEDGGELPAGQVGEIEVRAPWLMRGYWRRPGETAAAFHDGWLRSGDAGYLDTDGYLYIHDRVKDMIVSGGENIYPAEVENALFAHPAVADAAVIGVPDDTWGEAVKAFVVTADGQRADADELVAFVRQRIAGYKRPRSVEFVGELPRNASGKVLRRELREPYWRGADRRVN